ELQRIREDEFEASDASRDSYELVQEEQTEAPPDLSQYHRKRGPSQEPAVKNLPSRAPAPGQKSQTTTQEDSKGFWNTLKAWFAGPPQESGKQQENTTQKRTSRPSGKNGSQTRSRPASNGGKQPASR